MANPNELLLFIGFFFTGLDIFEVNPLATRYPNPLIFRKQKDSLMICSLFTFRKVASTPFEIQDLTSTLTMLARSFFRLVVPTRLPVVINLQVALTNYHIYRNFFPRKLYFLTFLGSF